MFQYSVFSFKWLFNYSWAHFRFEYLDLKRQPYSQNLFAATLGRRNIRAKAFQLDDDVHDDRLSVLLTWRHAWARECWHLPEHLVYISEFGMNWIQFWLLILPTLTHEYSKFRLRRVAHGRPLHIQPLLGKQERRKRRKTETDLIGLDRIRSHFHSQRIPKNDKANCRFLYLRKKISFKD